MGSLGSSQSSRCVFDKVCLSWISEFGISGTSLYLSCEGIVISSSSVGVSNSTLPSADSFTSRLFFFLSSLCTPPPPPLVPPKLNPGHGLQNVADPSREGRSRNNSWLQFNRLFNNRGAASPTRPQSVGGNYSTESARTCRPRILTYINYSLNSFIQL